MSDAFSPIMIAGALVLQDVIAGLILQVGLEGGSPDLDVLRVTLQDITFVGTYAYTGRDFLETLEANIGGQI